MGVIYSTDKRNNIIYIVWDGRINIDNWLQQISALSAEPDWPAISRIVADARTASTLGLNPAAVSQRLEELRGQLRRGPDHSVQGMTPD